MVTNIILEKFYSFLAAVFVAVCKLSLVVASRGYSWW